MALTEEQKGKVAEWLAAGAGLAEIQRRISEEFGVDMTYLDVRLLVAELPQPAEPEPPKAEEPSAAPDAGDDALPPEDALEDDGLPPPAPEGDAAGQPAAGGLSVTVDPLAPPGAIACGGVTFSDGTSGKWMLDQMGRLALSGLPEGYRPSPEDGAQFQPKLLAALRAKGLV